MEIEIKISIYEIDGKETSISGTDELEIKSHWNRDDWIILKRGDKSITVDGSDLKKAISRTTGWRWGLK